MKDIGAYAYSEPACGKFEYKFALDMLSKIEGNVKPVLKRGFVLSPLSLYQAVKKDMGKETYLILSGKLSGWILNGNSFLRVIKENPQIPVNYYLEISEEAKKVDMEIDTFPDYLAFLCHGFIRLGLKVNEKVMRANSHAFAKRFGNDPYGWKDACYFKGEPVPLAIGT